MQRTPKDKPRFKVLSARRSISITRTSAVAVSSESRSLVTCRPRSSSTVEKGDEKFSMNSSNSMLP